MDADRLTALFVTQAKPEGADKAGDKLPDKAAADHSGDNPAAGDLSSRLQLRSVIAEGNIIITREGSELSAYRIEYDPRDEWVIARGSDRNPARFTDPSGAGTFRAGELWLNTRTWAVKARDVNTRVGAASR
jgi:hypothetical protein